MAGPSQQGHTGPWTAWSWPEASLPPTDILGREALPRSGESPKSQGALLECVHICLQTPIDPPGYRYLQGLAANPSVHSGHILSSGQHREGTQPNASRARYRPLVHLLLQDAVGCRWSPFIPSQSPTLSLPGQDGRGSSDASLRRVG